MRSKRKKRRWEIQERSSSYELSSQLGPPISSAPAAARRKASSHKHLFQVTETPPPPWLLSLLVRNSYGNGMIPRLFVWQWRHLASRFVGEGGGTCRARSEMISPRNGVIPAQGPIASRCRITAECTPRGGPLLRFGAAATGPREAQGKGDSIFPAEGFKRVRRGKRPSSVEHAIASSRVIRSRDAPDWLETVPQAVEGPLGEADSVTDTVVWEYPIARFRARSTQNFEPMFGLQGRGCH